jgi:NADH:ubiquinone oxidoreductase subunit 2 (subunit N)
VSSGGFLFLLFSASCDPIFSTIAIAYAVYSIGLAVPLILFLLLSDPHQTNYPHLDLSALSQLKSASGAVAVSLAGVFYAVAGLPPTVGFWLKLFAAYFLSISLGFPIAFCSLLAISILNLFLFLRIVSALFFYPPLSESLPRLEFNAFQISLLVSFALLPYFLPLIFIETWGILFFHLLVFAVH